MPESAGRTSWALHDEVILLYWGPIAAAAVGPASLCTTVFGVMNTMHACVHANQRVPGPRAVLLHTTHTRSGSQHT